MRSRRAGRGAGAALCVLLAAPAIGCATPGVQDIHSDLDGIQEQLFRVQKENAEMAEKIAALQKEGVAAGATSEGASPPELELRIEAIERDLAALSLRHDQSDQRLTALAQDLRSTREAVQALLRAGPHPAGEGESAEGGAIPGSDEGGPETAGPPPTAGGSAGSPVEAADAASTLAMADLFQQGYSDYQKENYALALVEFEQFAESYPASDKADDALFYIGEVYYAQGEYSDAVKAFDRVVKEYPGGNEAGPAYLKKGLALLELNRTADAVIQLNHVITAYPQSEEARIARDRLEGLGLSPR